MFGFPYNDGLSTVVICENFSFLANVNKGKGIKLKGQIFLKAMQQKYTKTSNVNAQIRKSLNAFYADVNRQKRRYFPLFLYENTE